MSLEQAFSLRIDGCDLPLKVRSFRATERTNAPFRLVADIEVAAEDGERELIDPEAVLGQKAVFEISDEDAPRVFRGIVDSFACVAGGYRAALVPEIAVLADSVDHRVYLDQDASAIVKDVLDRHGIAFESRAMRTPEKRAQCVQAFESDLDFVSRLLADEGISYHLEDDGSAALVILSDAPSGRSPIPGGDDLVWTETAGAGLSGDGSVFDVALRRTMTSSKYVVRDFDFEKPLVNPTSEKGDGSLELYEFPAGFVDPKKGAELAGLRLEEAQSAKVVLEGRSTCRRLFPGGTFSLSKAPHKDANHAWLVVAVDHQGSDHGAGERGGQRYTATFRAVPSDTPHRPARRPRPTLGGIQTATVTGPSGGEIHTEQHGRIRAHLRWDRLRPMDDTASAWVRPMQPALSGGVLLPRVGWEVLLGFESTSADEPYELGRVYNGEAVPPEGLPGKKVRSVFGSLTTPGGGGGNTLTLDDAAGSEGMTLGASKDMNERTENDKVTSVKGDHEHKVGANRTETVGIVQSVKVDGSQTYTVDGNRTLTTVGNYSIHTGTESVSVGGLRMFKVGGDMETQAATLTRTVGGAKGEAAIQEVNRHVTGVATVAVGGGWIEIGGLSASTSVLGASALNVAGPLNVKAREISVKASALKEDYASRKVKAGGKRVEAYGASAKYKIGGSLKMKGSNVFFSAKSMISIQASSVKVKITASAVKIDGPVEATDASVVTGDETND